MKKLMCVAALAVSLAVAGRLCADPSDWTAFSPMGEKFSISFPGDPTSETKTAQSPLGDIHMTFYSDLADSVVYQVGVLELPEEVQALANKDPESALSGFALGLAKGAKEAKVKVISQKKIKMGDHQGVEIKASIFDGKGVFYCRAILTEDRVYMLMVVAPASKDVTTEVKGFFRSFEVQDRITIN